MLDKPFLVGFVCGVIVFIWIIVGTEALRLWCRERQTMRANRAVLAHDRWRKQRIASAAILIEGKVWAVPPPGRHNDVMALYRRCGGVWSQEYPQGFMTNDGDFVDRTVAAQIALRSGQAKPPLIMHDELSSEDVW